MKKPGAPMPKKSTPPTKAPSADALRKMPEKERKGAYRKMADKEIC